jgi:hypothetical protein
MTEPGKLEGFIHASTVMSPETSAFVDDARPMWSVEPLNVLALFSMPAETLVELPDVPVLELPELSETFVVPLDSFKCQSPTVYWSATSS